MAQMQKITHERMGVGFLLSQTLSTWIPSPHYKCIEDKYFSESIQSIEIQFLGSIQKMLFFTAAQILQNPLIRMDPSFMAVFSTKVQMTEGK